MPLQTAVNRYNALGIIGDFAFDGPRRVEIFNLDSDTQAQVIGYAFTRTDGGANPNPSLDSSNAGSAKVGGTGVFAGILVNGKVYSTNGGAGGPLTPTLTLPDNVQGELCQMGEPFVSLPAAANTGDLVLYNTTTGALSTVAPSSSFTGVVATNTLTVSAFVAGGAPLGVGSVIAGTGVVGGTVITALGTGTGGNGTYTVNGAATVSSTAMTGTAIAPAGTKFVPNCVVSRYAVTSAGVGVIKLTN